jgi:hypothetical protein
MPTEPASPKVDRPLMPKQYGLPKHKKGLLPWSYIVEQMTEAKHYFICTVTPDGRPHAIPVEGLWLEDTLYFGGSPQTRWQRNLAANPHISVHLENALKVVILRGHAYGVGRIDRALAEMLATASKEKYGYTPRREDYQNGGVYVFRPYVVIAWKQFPKDATRWRFSL